MKVVTYGKSTALALGLTGIALLSILALAVYSSIELVRFERVETRRTLVVYAPGQTLFRGMHVRMIDLTGTLSRLGYVETRALPTPPRQFRRPPVRWEVFLRH